MLALFALFACFFVCLFARLSSLQWCCGGAQLSLVFFPKKKEVALGWEVGLGCWGLSALSYPAPVGRNGVRVGAWGMGHGVFR